MVNIADITMCLTENCPLADKCYRKTATPSTYQSFQYFKLYLDKEKETCEMFYPINKTNDKEIYLKPKFKKTTNIKLKLNHVGKLKSKLHIDEDI